MGAAASLMHPCAAGLYVAAIAAAGGPAGLAAGAAAIHPGVVAVHVQECNLPWHQVKDGR